MIFYPWKSSQSERYFNPSSSPFPLSFPSLPGSDHGSAHLYFLTQATHSLSLFLSLSLKEVWRASLDPRYTHTLSLSPLYYTHTLTHSLFLSETVLLAHPQRRLHNTFSYTIFHLKSLSITSSRTFYMLEHAKTIGPNGSGPLPLPL